MSTVVDISAQAPVASVQPNISHNVRILMAYKGVDQRVIGTVIHKTATAVGHKLNGRATWTPDEIAQLAVFGGSQWPVQRFFADPEGEQPSFPNIRTKLRAIPGLGRDPQPRTPLLTGV